jgi:GntR family transcriptional regulator
VPMKVIAGALPKYRQLLQLLRQQILSGELAPGARLPTEEELALRYGLSRGTVRKAVEQLSAEGLVYAEQGSGTYVSAAHPSAVPFRFTDCTPGAPATYRVITQEVIPAAMAIAERLSLPLGEPVVHIRRLRLEGEEVSGFSERFLPQSLCPDLLAEDLAQQSVHDILVNRSELPLLRAVVEIEAQMLDVEDAALLGVPAATPAIVVTRITYTAPNRPAVWYRAVYRDAYCLAVRVDTLAAEER